MRSASPHLPTRQYQILAGAPSAARDWRRPPRGPRPCLGLPASRSPSPARRATPRKSTRLNAFRLFSEREASTKPPGGRTRRDSAPTPKNCHSGGSQAFRVPTVLDRRMRHSAHEPLLNEKITAEMPAEVPLAGLFLGQGHGPSLGIRPIALGRVVDESKDDRFRATLPSLRQGVPVAARRGSREPAKWPTCVLRPAHTAAAGAMTTPDGRLPNPMPSPDRGFG